MWGDEIQFVADNSIPRGEPKLSGMSSPPTWFVHPYDLLQQELRGKLPLYTRHTLGAIEAERDRRRYG
jgi:hypothetical protein